jgi:hypothetical protein
MRPSATVTCRQNRWGKAVPREITPEQFEQLARDLGTVSVVTHTTLTEIHEVIRDDFGCTVAERIQTTNEAQTEIVAEAASHFEKADCKLFVVTKHAVVDGDEYDVGANPNSIDWVDRWPCWCVDAHSAEQLLRMYIYLSRTSPELFALPPPSKSVLRQSQSPLADREGVAVSAPESWDDETPAF